MNTIEAQNLAIRAAKTFFTGLDDRAAYGLGNRDFVCEARCEFCGENGLVMLGGYYDGYRWQHPYCPDCKRDVKTYQPLIDWARHQ